MKIKDLLNGVCVKKCVNFDEKTLNLNVKHIIDNTNNKKIKNSLFVCISGFNFDSHQNSKNFAHLGIKFAVCEKEIETTLPYIIVENTREVLGILCDNFYHHPTKAFTLVGVIGTNGKTSTTNFIKQLLNLNHKKCSLIGTSGVTINNKKLKETLTTPDPLILYALFDKARKAKSDVVVMEISAHAIKLNKVKNLCFDIVCFTNFSQDHLDFFGTMENYKQTKFSFFNKKNVKKAIINIDDEAGSELFLKIKDDIEAKTFSLTKKADYMAKITETKINKTKFGLSLDNFSRQYLTNVPCKFNLYNILCATSVVKELGYCVDESCFSKLKNVKGRFDVFNLTENRFVLIDYAHTPESLENVLISVKNLFSSNIIALFGCPGNRDETKRRIMGEIAHKYCEKIYITTDNPKFENPLIICEEILSGAKEKGIVIEDRTKAIKTAIKNLNSGEILCVIGKGCEEYQDINNKKIKYSDYTVVSKCIKRIKKQ
ncbi:MAG: UDP-N-acetylmuramoyl-L-alanyl-D-glutamate--2,6-diaminopimelate ligase [Christensenellales bacterium]